MMILLLSLIIALVSVVFALQNAFPVTVSFLFWEFQASFALLLLITFVSGVLVTLLVTMPQLFQSVWMTRKQERKLAQLEEEMNRKESPEDVTPQSVSVNRPLNDN